ncbi:MAG: nuclear transport factor 2 family protein [Pseudomonadota bacterium]
MKSLKEVAELTVEYNNNGRMRELLDLVYADTVQSIEAGPMPDGSAGVTGIEALKGKWDWWEGANEVHSSSAEGPMFHGDDRFSVIFEMDVTDKASGQRMQMKEVAVYTVADGKIVKEEFFYATE